MSNKNILINGDRDMCICFNYQLCLTAHSLSRYWRFWFKYLFIFHVYIFSDGNNNNSVLFSDTLTENIAQNDTKNKDEKSGMNAYIVAVLHTALENHFCEDPRVLRHALYIHNHIFSNPRKRDNHHHRRQQ